MPGLRPTSARIRETLFNWLTPTIHGTRCLDLYAGTGALGLEALSRGAAETVFVEKSRAAVATLEKNIQTLCATTAYVHAGDALGYLQGEHRGQFDIVFLDPPFAADMLGELCRLLDETSVLACGAQVYIEEDRSRPEVVLPVGWQITRSQQAGNVRYSLVTPVDRG